VSNPKCPWCGGNIEVRGIVVYHHTCENMCYASQNFYTKKEAIAAASKRFMPKRSVEEIKNKWRQLINLRDEEMKSTLEGKVMSTAKLDLWWDIAFAKLITRIADFIYGVTE